MYLIKVRWFNIIAPLVAFAAVILVVPSVHAQTSTSTQISFGPTGVLSRTYTAGVANVLMGNFLVDATRYSLPSKISAFVLSLETSGTFPSSISNCYLLSPSGVMTSRVSPSASATQGASHYFYYSNPLLIDYGNSYIFQLRCDIAQSAAGGSVSWRANSTPWITDQQTGSPLPVALTNPNQPVTVNLQNNIANAYTVSLTPLNMYQTAVANSVFVQLSQFKFTNNVSENILIRQIALTNWTNGASQLTGQMVTIWNGTTQVGAAYMGTSTGAIATLTTPVLIPAYDAVTLSIRGDLAAQGLGLQTTPGSVVSIGYNGSKQGVGGNYAVGATSGSMYTGSTALLNPSGTKIFRTLPKVSDVSMPMSVLAVGTDLTKMQISASPTRDVLLRRMTFDVISAPCTVASNFVLYGPMGRVHALDQQITNGRLAITFDDTNVDRQIPAGTSKTYTLRTMSLSGVTTTNGGSISIRMRNDVGYPFTTMGSVSAWESLSGTTSNNFLWSPNSTTTPEASVAKNFNADWANAFGVPGYPYLGAHFPLKTFGAGNGTCPSAIQLLAPVGGETIMPNAGWLEILWMPEDLRTNIAFYLDKYATSSFTTVGKMIVEQEGPTAKWYGAVGTAGNYVPAGNYYVRIVDVTSGRWDRSDSFITVLPIDYVKADLKISGSNGPLQGKATSTLATWTSTNAFSCSLEGQYRIPLMTFGSSTGSMIINLESNDGANAEKILLTCFSGYGSRKDTVDLLPLPYRSDLYDELNGYALMKRALRRSAFYYYTKKNVEVASWDVTDLINQSVTELKPFLASTSPAWGINEQLIAVAQQAHDAFWDRDYSNIDALYTQLNTLLAQLRTKIEYVPPACSDGLDNDADGKVDMMDSGCSSSTDNDEYSAPVSYGANVLSNPGFESQKSGWSGWGTKVKLSTSEKYSGTYGLEMIHGTSGSRTLNSGTTYAVVPGSKVKASTWIKTVGSGTTDAFFELEWRNAWGSILGKKQLAYTGGATGWRQLQAEYTVPANATKLKVRLKDMATPSVGSVFFDDASVQLAETVTASEGFFSRMFSNVLTAVQAVSASR